VRCIDETEQSKRCFFQFQRRLESVRRRAGETEQDVTSPVRHW
jgi:predicted adenine nucleotide alpha hydrolase (AANH) superfamily ATPase